MSHYLDILTEITDRDALVRALKRMGFRKKDTSRRGQGASSHSGDEPIEIHEIASALYGYQGDRRKQKAHVIIRRSFVGSSSNDIGFEKMPDGRFKAHISEFESATGQYAGGSGKYDKEWQDKLYTYYGVEKAKSEFDRKGLKYKEDVDEKERPRLRVFI